MRIRKRPILALAALNTSAYAVKGLPRAELETRAEAGDVAAQMETTQ